jgi:hypothetical protein
MAEMNGMNSHSNNKNTQKSTEYRFQGLGKVGMEKITSKRLKNILEK